MILVTGAAGKTGRAVVAALVSRGEEVRALVRRREQVEVLEHVGARDVVIGDMRVERDLRQAARGVRAIYCVCPNMSPSEEDMGCIAIDAAAREGIELFAYHSVLHPQTHDMPHHWSKLRVEEALFKSGLTYTILQPAAYMQNLIPYWPQVRADGVYAVPYGKETRLSLVDLEDVAAAVAVVMTEDGHAGATYELCGPRALTQTEIAMVLSQTAGREVRVEVLDLGLWAKDASSAGMSDYQVETLTKMFHYYDRYGLWGSGRVLEWLLGRSPTTLEQFVKRELVGGT